MTFGSTPSEWEAGRARRKEGRHRDPDPDEPRPTGLEFIPEARTLTLKTAQQEVRVSPSPSQVRSEVRLEFRAVR